MKRLTFKEPSGKWGIVGMEKPVDEIEDFSIYICLEKLCDYEELGLNPDDIDSKLFALREALGEYKETGLKPGDIRRLKSKLEDMKENLQTAEKEVRQLTEENKRLKGLLKKTDNVAVQAKWEKAAYKVITSDNAEECSGHVYACSNCKAAEFHKSLYCRCCGARMDKEEIK